MAKIRKQETLDYTALKRELKSKGPENLYMLWGPEDYLIADFVSSLRDICVSGEMRDFDAKRLNGPLPDARDVEDALNAMPFFGGRTFVELNLRAGSLTRTLPSSRPTTICSSSTRLTKVHKRNSARTLLSS